MKSIGAWMFAAALLIPGAAFAQPFDVKGDALNMTLADFRAKYRRPASDSQFAPFCSDKSPEGAYIRLPVKGIGAVRCLQHYPYEERRDPISRRYVPPTTIAGTNARLMYSFIADDPANTDDSDFVLYELTATFPSSSFHSVRDGLIEKFGAPSKKDTETLQNRMGATFSAQVLYWFRDNRYGMKLREYFSDLETSHLTLSDITRTAEYIRRVKAKRSVESAKDL